MNVKLLYDNTESLSYETNIFECFKDKAYNSAETKLSDKEYTLLANSLNRHHDQIFKDNHNKFLDIPLRDWPKKKLRERPRKKLKEKPRKKLKD